MMTVIFDRNFSAVKYQKEKKYKRNEIVLKVVLNFKETKKGSSINTDYVHSNNVQDLLLLLLN